MIEFCGEILFSFFLGILLYKSGCSGYNLFSLNGLRFFFIYYFVSLLSLSGVATAVERERKIRWEWKVGKRGGGEQEGG